MEFCEAYSLIQQCDIKPNKNFDLSGYDMDDLMETISYALVRANAYRWHKVTSTDLPEDGEEVLAKFSTSWKHGKIDSYEVCGFAKDLNAFDNFDFPSKEYKGKSGFYSYDSEQGYYEVKPVAWKRIEEDI